MLTQTKPLYELTAADVMSRTVVSVPREMPLQAVIQVFLEQEVSGAPVVDRDGRCVGVVSARDVVRWAGKAGAEFADDCHPVVFVSDWEMSRSDVWPEGTVGDFMTADPVTASPATPLRELARRMIDAHIHRVVVTDAAGRPLGVVSTTDIVAAVARPGDEGP
jgi:CBS domain-containing protein